MPLSTLSYGYLKPSNPTFGDQFFPALEDNIQLMNDHTHNGTNGARIAKATSTVSAGSWGSDLGGGAYRQEITLPTGFTFDTVKMEVRRSTGEVTYNTIEKTASTKFYIYTNDNTLAYTIVYV